MGYELMRLEQAGTTRTAELRQKLAAEAKEVEEKRAAKEQEEADKLKDPSHPANVRRRLWKELMRLLQQASNEQLGKKEGDAAGALPAHARTLRIAEIKMELGMYVVCLKCRVLRYCFTRVMCWCHWFESACDSLGLGQTCNVLHRVEKDKTEDGQEEDVLAAASSSDAKLMPRLTMIEQQVPGCSDFGFVCECDLTLLVVQSLLAVKQKKDKAVSDVLRKFKMSDLDEPSAPAVASGTAAKGRVTPRKK